MFRILLAHNLSFAVWKYQIFWNRLLLQAIWIYLVRKLNVSWYEIVIVSLYLPLIWIFLHFAAELLMWFFFFFLPMWLIRECFLIPHWGCYIWCTHYNYFLKSAKIWIMEHFCSKYFRLEIVDLYLICLALTPSHYV